MIHVWQIFWVIVTKYVYMYEHVCGLTYVVFVHLFLKLERRWFDDHFWLACFVTDCDKEVCVCVCVCVCVSVRACVRVRVYEGKVKSCSLAYN